MKRGARLLIIILFLSLIPVIGMGQDCSIVPVDPLCIYDGPYDMEATVATGAWSGKGVIDPERGLFDPAVAGLGRHQITFIPDPEETACSGIAYTEVVVADLPLAEFLTNDSSWCDQEDNTAPIRVLLTGTDSSTFDLEYSISGVTNTLTGQSAGIVEFQVNNQPGINEYILTQVTEHHGSTSCETSFSDTVIFTVGTSPDATLETTYNTPCSPAEVKFTADPGYETYTWYFGEGAMPTPWNQFSHTFSVDSGADSTFLVSLKVESLEGCFDSTTTTVTVYPSPAAGFLADPDTVIYPDTTISLTNTTSPGAWSYLWDFGDGTGDSSKEPGAHSFTGFGLFDIQLKAFSETCIDSVTKRVMVLPPPPLAAFGPDTAGCPPLLVQFSNRSLYADSLSWDFGDNHLSSEANPLHRFETEGEYQVTLVASGLSGADSTEGTITVYEKPVANFSASTTRVTNLEEPFIFSNNSDLATEYLWDFGDGTTSTEPEPNHLYQNSGTYTVTLYVWSEYECADTLVRNDYLRVNAEEGSIDFPNAFIWNQSGSSGGHWDEGTIDNTIFHPAVINVEELRMVIYTRWGEKLFETNDIYIGWDGYLASGEPATEGVYIWKAWIKFLDGTETEQVGDITFLHHLPY
ncbi:MAG: PKD domain-containing protein [Bacteroidota bacterium]